MTVDAVYQHHAQPAVIGIQVLTERSAQHTRPHISEADLWIG